MAYRSEGPVLVDRPFVVLPSRRVLLREQADSAGADEQTDDDEHDSPEHLAAEQRHDASDHKHSRENQQQKFHAETDTPRTVVETSPRVRGGRRSSRPGLTPARAVTQP